MEEVEEGEVDDANEDDSEEDDEDFEEEEDWDVDADGDSFPSPKNEMEDRLISEIMIVAPLVTQLKTQVKETVDRMTHATNIIKEAISEIDDEDGDDAQAFHRATG